MQVKYKSAEKNYQGYMIANHILKCRSNQPTGALFFFYKGMFNVRSEETNRAPALTHTYTMQHMVVLASTCLR